jgi:predicted membrane channel-forming protein YqfA (hemolysin III family)
VWALALFTFLTKLHGGRLDTFALHVPCFLLMGWYALACWPPMTSDDL